MLISQWDPTRPSWSKLLQIVNDLKQTAWFTFKADWHLSSHILVASDADEIMGFLYFVTQEIGIEEDHAVVAFAGQNLVEAKVIAFGVVPNYRRQGIGRELQLAAMALATELGCYQMRSHSGSDSLANHQLKLALGFSVHPILRGDDTAGVYFLKTLSPTLTNKNLP
jgi:GNAT superfamily N-acetyltransferase